MSPWITLSEKGFNAGNVSNITTKIPILGGIHEMLIKISNKNAKWICSKIIVTLQYRLWQFLCSEVILGGDEYSISVSGSSVYKLNIVSKTAMDDIISMKLYGSEYVTPMFMLTDTGFKEGIISKIIKTSEVGEVYKIALKKNFESGPWTYDSITIEHPIGTKPIQFQGKTLVSQIVQSIGRPKSSSSAPKSGSVDVTVGRGPEGDIVDDIKIDLDTVDMDISNKHYMGGCLNKKDLDNLNYFSCDATIKSYLLAFNIAEPANNLAGIFPN